MGADDGNPRDSSRRIPPGLIAIAVVLVIAGSVFNNWHRQALLVALKESLLTLAIVAILLAILAAIEILLHGRVRLWGRIGGLAIVSGVVLWRLFHGGSTIIASIAGIAWIAVIGFMVVAMLRNRDLGR
ncbi:hypothetical protein [Sphingomonas pruni]|uniref:hypothetical protein n=1 Tax=Sphingomonas pruni TaxID=40683 RepID=UPI00082DAB82|nr:hypothetical protein [Sphingomonas pruni]